MVTEKFRRQLRHESEQWWAEGLINAELYEKLADRYQFNTLEHDASHRFVAILMGLGGILLGLGAITFVAANWQDWSRPFKIVLLLSLFAGVNAVGFYLWRRPANQRFQKLGHGLLLLGALVLGANMALMSQIFHQSGNFYELLLVWGLGVVAMAYSLRLTSLSVLSLILVGWGYSLGWVAWSSGQDGSVWQLLVRHMPLVASVLYIPLAYWCRSRAVFALGAILIAAALVFNLNPLAGWWYGYSLASGWIIAIAFTLPPALLWAYDRRMWQFSAAPKRSTPRLLRHATPPDPFQPIARSLTIWFFSILFYTFAFRWLWQVSPSSYYPIYQWQYEPMIDAIVLSLFAGLGWLQLRHQLGDRPFWQHLWRPKQPINSGMVAGMMALTGALFIWHAEVSQVPGLATFAFNVMFFWLAIALIRDGLALGNRPTFWGGMVLLVLGIVTRMLEYNTGLLLKSIVFALCGAGVIVAGLWFERSMQPRTPPALARPSQEET